MAQSRLLREYDQRNLRRIRPWVGTFAELKAAFYADPATRHFLTHPWFEKELHDLWLLGAPDPQTWDKRLLLPSQMHKFCHEVAVRLSTPVLKNA